MWGEYLPRCLDSITGQTYRNLEIILINDGSTDRSPEIAEEYAKRDHRISLIHQKNAGLSESRNVGMRLSRGDYLSFIDSDDFIESDYHETLYGILHAHDADIAICGKQVIHSRVVHPFPTGVPEGITLYSGSEALTELVQDKWLCNYVWDKLFKKVLFDGIEFPEGRTYEDIAVMPKIFYRARKIVITDQVKYNYRVRKESITGSRTIGHQYHCFLAHVERVSFFESINRDDLALKASQMALQTVMDAVMLSVLRRPTDSEKNDLKAMEDWASSVRNKIHLLPYERSSETKKVRLFFSSNKFFRIRYAPTELFSRGKNFIKHQLPDSLIRLYFMIKSDVRNNGVRS
ncbi:MAG TPA: glycosyltransferase [Smithella sp.]|nr:glycosyltransferase [Smithella sp.]